MQRIGNAWGVFVVGIFFCVLCVRASDSDDGRCFMVYEFDVVSAAHFYNDNFDLFLTYRTFVYYTVGDVGAVGDILKENGPAVFVSTDSLQIGLNKTRHAPRDAPVFIAYALFDTWVTRQCSVTFHLEGDILVTKAQNFRYGPDNRTYASASEYVRTLFDDAEALPPTVFLLSTEVPQRQKVLRVRPHRWRCAFNSNSIFNFRGKVAGVYFMFLAQVYQLNRFHMRTLDVSNHADDPEFLDKSHVYEFGIDWKFSKFLQANRGTFGLDKFCNISHVNAAREIMSSSGDLSPVSVPKTPFVHCHHRKLDADLDNCQRFLI